MTVFYTWQFPIQGGPSPGRTMPERLSDVINVKDWGAVGSGLVDDSAAVQNAIDYCMSTTGGKAAGGTVFFPAGNYGLSGNGLTIGSSDNTVGVQFLGVGSRTTLITSVYNGGFILSKGANTYDNLVRVEGLTVSNPSTAAGTGGIQLVGNGQSVYNCYISGLICIDASAAVNCSIIDTQGAGTDSQGGPGTSYPFSQSGIGIYLGTSCSVISCRFNGGTFIGYALSGEGASCISGSVENMYCAYRLGWAPELTAQTNANATTGDTILQFAASSFSSLTVLIIGRAVSGTFIPADTIIDDVSVSGANVLVTISAAITNNIASGSTITFGQETPAIGCTLEAGQTEACPIGIDVYNAKNCLIQSVAVTGAVGPGAQSQNFTNLVWDSTTHLVTATTSGDHHLTTGTTPLNVVTSPSGFDPNFWAWATYTSSMATNVFTYPGLSSDPGAFVSGNWGYPLQMAMRVRAATECSFINNDFVLMNNAFACIDLDYATLANGQHTGSGQTATNQANNVIISHQGSIGGWLTSSNIGNRAGWQFIQCGAGAVDATRNTENTISHPYGTLTFDCLPGRAGVLQDGPFEAQEFNIIDCTLTSSGNFATTVSSGESGGTNHVKVRYDGTNWRISG